MNAQQGWIAEALVETRRLEEESFHFGAVGAVELGVVDFRELQFIEPGLVGEGQLPPLVADAKKHFGGQMGLACQTGDLAVVALREAPQAQRAFDEPLKILAAGVDARQMAFAAVFEYKAHFAAIRGEAR